MSNDSSKLYNERMKNPAFKAAYNAFSEGLSRGLQLQEMAFYMFLEGIKYEKNRVKSSQN